MQQSKWFSTRDVVQNDFLLIVENAVARAFIDGSMECLLITGVIVSSGFSIKVAESSDGRFAFDVPAIENLLSAKGNKVQISSANSTDISFKGEKNYRSHLRRYV